MKKVFLLFTLGILTTLFCAAQQTDLLVKSGDKGLFLEHKVVPKEGLYSIGRLYTVHPKHIAAYNKLDMSKGLAISQIVRIPLTDTNFTQKGNTGTPVYYVTGEKEGLLKVSSAHRNVSLDNLRNWNGITDNALNPGDKLVIGFLISKEMPSVTLNGKSPSVIPAKKEEKPAVLMTETAVDQKPVIKTDPPKEEPKKTEILAEQKAVIKQEPKKEEPRKEGTKKAEPVFAKQETKGANTENGFFKFYFDQQVRKTPVKKEETVTSGIFKTTSGWLDAKYYLLMDNIQPGTIVKITNPSNNKFIYAKVLGEMSGISQNAGLNIRISSAGASALQVSEEDKFILKVNY